MFCLAVLNRLRPLLALVLWREWGQVINASLDKIMIRTISVQSSGPRRPRGNSGVFWLTKTKGTQRLWRFILFIAAVADPVNQVYCFKGKHSHRGVQKPTAPLGLGSVLYHPLSLKLSVNNGPFCRKKLWMLFLVPRNQFPFENIVWLNGFGTGLTVVLIQPFSSVDMKDLYKSLQV